MLPPDLRRGRRMERIVEALILGTRWLLLPLYLALLVSVCGIYVMVGRELMHVFIDSPSAAETDFLLNILSVLDLVLIANLMVMVGVGSYESFISRIDSGKLGNKPEWLGKLDSSNVKVKVALSI